MAIDRRQWLDGMIDDQGNGGGCAVVMIYMAVGVTALWAAVMLAEVLLP